MPLLVSCLVWQLRLLQNTRAGLEDKPFFESAEFTKLLSRGREAQSGIRERGLVSRVS